jgi:hypothetical protein
MELFGLADCNNFYCSCERVFHPDLIGKPVVVLSNNDGCVIARSEESKALGIKMGEPFFQVKELLEQNDVAVFSSNYNLYGDMSRRVMSLLSRYSPKVDVYSVDELSAIHSVIEKFIFFVQPKWKIANDIPGSGNTRNIGGITSIKKLLNGQGPFADLGEEVFDDYWKGYFNKVDARTAGIGAPRYNNLKTYKQYLQQQQGLLKLL